VGPSEVSNLKTKSLLSAYNKKRNFENTNEPEGTITKKYAQEKLRNFVVQKHDATRLHYDFRLESEDGVLKSWAVPKGPSMNPKIKRLAIMVEDHPFDYLHFEGTIPKGNYGAGTVIVWDTGSYSSKEPVAKQIDTGKVTIELYGNKLKGLFKLVRTKRENQWLLMKASDKFASEDDLTEVSPESVLSSKTNLEMESEPEAVLGSSKTLKKGDSTFKRVMLGGNKGGENNEGDLFPKIKPMLAHPFEKAFDNPQWVFEIKWDGVRALVFKKDRKFKIQSRNGNDITMRYPEIVTAAKFSLRGCKSAILDGEIVILNKEGIPDFHTHQHRMHIQTLKEIMALSVEHPSTYYVFDILYKDDQSVEDLAYLERRELISSILKTNDTIKISEYIAEKGTKILASSKELKLEGIVAKHKGSIYREGIRSRDWLKIKNTRTQDCVIIGYTEGLGSRIRHFGSLVLAVYSANDKKLKFSGHVGTGFDDQTLTEIYSKLKVLKVGSMPIDKVPYLNRDTTWIEPILVAEVKFDEWTPDGILRAPVFLRLRDDKKPNECVIEADKPIKNFSQVGNDPKSKLQNIHSIDKTKRKRKSNVAVTNTNKVYWKATKQHPAFLKADLIEYYDKISEVILPHLEDRPLSLNRYPNGISGKSFYQKDWAQKKPDFVATAKIHSERRGGSINYIICNNRETLLWVANLGCIEMHPWYSRIKDFGSCNSSTKLYEEKCGLNFPDFILFDLDPYIYSGKEKKGEEPQYNIGGFKAAVDIAHELEDIFKELKIKSYLKTSGKSGIHIYVPVANIYTYDQTKSFAEAIANIMVNRSPTKVTLEWSTSKRKGKVFFDYNQNARGKTVASVYSLRPTVDANVSMPVDWKNIDDTLPTDFTIANAPDIIRKNDLWHGIFSDKQDIGKLISQVKELS
jgi:bifunctional non-homologous end joining protein LigD